MDHLLKTASQFSYPGILPSDLLLANELAYVPCGLIVQNFVKEKESEEYSAFVFELNEMRIKFRAGKITPTKIGQFVTFWKRIGEGVILPHDLDDPFDFFVVSVREGNHFGQFVFPKALLVEKGIVSRAGKGGKRAMRIYPPWNIAVNRQAILTQTWQLKYFFEVHENKTLGFEKIRKLFCME